MKQAIDEDAPPTKEQFLEGLKEAVEKVKLIRAGKLKVIHAKDLLDEL
jgi:hypothetical protein